MVVSPSNRAIAAAKYPPRRRVCSEHNNACSAVRRGVSSMRQHSKAKLSQEKSATYQEIAKHHLRLLLCWLRLLPWLEDF